MKKINLYILLAGLTFLLPACAKYTEIVPKGKNTLSRVSDLDLVLNFNFSQNQTVQVGSQAARITAETAFKFDELNILVNDIYPYVTNVNNMLNDVTKTLNYALFTGDETLDRAQLTSTDEKYQKMYFIINNVCNIVLSSADQASGDKTLVPRLKAEAYILRAYFHYWLVNIYAKAYTPATAATDGGIPYVKEDNLLTELNTKLTVAEVYKNILADIEAAFALNSLPVTPVNKMRVSLPFAHAVKAQVLMSMRNYSGALEAVNSSLALNSTLENFRLYAPVGTLTFTKRVVSAPDNLFYASAGAAPSYYSVSKEILTFFEPGNILKDYINPFIAGDFITGIPGSLLWGSFVEYGVNSAGLATKDMYLLKAECLARANQIPESMSIINQIRQNRIHSSVYAPLTAATEAQAMAHLQKLSRSEFLFTGKNFLNIKRWNTEDAYKQTISKTVPVTKNNVTTMVTYTLSPTSPLWIFPFPQSATNYNPHLNQNY